VTTGSGKLLIGVRLSLSLVGRVSVLAKTRNENAGKEGECKEKRQLKISAKCRGRPAINLRSIPRSRRFPHDARLKGSILRIGLIVAGPVAGAGGGK
jgi:hypothetical protein